MRTRLVELGRDLQRSTEEAADSIDAATADARIHRNTLLWRLSSVPSITEAALREDPVVATLDLAAYRAQLIAFLASPAGEASFGPGVVIARRAVAGLEADWESSAAATGARMSPEARTRFGAWVADHPIERVPYNRPSIVAAVAGLMSVQATGIGAAVGDIGGSLQRLELRASLANEYAIKQAVWLAQLAALDARASPEASQLRSALTTTHELAERAPDIVARERGEVLSDVDRQRRETLAAMSRERQIVLDTLALERQTVLEAMDVQRRQVMLDADSLRARLVGDSFRVVDHIFLRFAELLAGLAALVAAGIIVLRRRSPSGPPAPVS